MPQIVADSTLNDFYNSVSPMLYAEEVLQSLMIGLCEGCLSQPPPVLPLMLRISENEKTLGALFQMAPGGIVILSSGTNAQLEALAADLIRRETTFAGVVGPSAVVDEFMAVWKKRGGPVPGFWTDQLIYELEKVNFPTAPPSGRFREATNAESELLQKWLSAFAREVLPQAEWGTAESWRHFVTTGLVKRILFVWEHEGRPVTVVRIGRTSKNTATVNFVYTPPSERKQGYASMVTAAISQHILDSGKKFAVLYTDAANPTSNKIYRDIGYREVAKSKYYHFKK